MQKNKLDISIIIVHYNVRKELFECISSIYKSGTLVNFEIIVVDNDEIKIIKDELKEKFPKVKYIENKNTGWGGGINKGLESAKGKYIYLLNPDTIVQSKAIDNAFSFIEKTPNAGVVSSLLLDTNKKIYPLQGTKLLNPINAIFSLSFINKFFPNNRISKSFWMRGRSKKEVEVVESATLSAALINKDVLLKAGKFDEGYFLYYEEYDLARRIKKLGLTNYIIPNSKVIHIWEASTSKTGRVGEFIKNSRQYYFKKYYGSFIANFVEFFLSFGKKEALFFSILFGILLVGSFLRINQLDRFVSFIGDQAWFYISARDMIVNSSIPLLGITSSHTWIHQGPLWTYMLAPILLLFNFNPIGGFYLSSFIGIISILASYKLASEFFSRRLGIIFALLFATSPLVVFHSRFAYHTSPISLLVLLLFYSFIKWTKNDVRYFPIIVLLMSLLYNFELATVIFWPVIITFFITGIILKKKYVKDLLNKKTITLTLFAFLLPMIPVLIYDFGNGFPQTFVFAGWFGYKFLQFLEIIEKSSVDNSSIMIAFNFFLEKYSQLIYAASSYASYLILISSLVVPTVLLVKRKLPVPYLIIVFLTLFALTAFLLSGVPSEAYLVILFPGLLFMASYAFYQIKNIFVLIALLISIAVLNIYYLLSTNYLTINTVTLDDKNRATEQIIEIANGAEIDLVYRGDGEKFESTVMPYDYLLWLRRDKMYYKNKIKILVFEKKDKITIRKVYE